MFGYSEGLDSPPPHFPDRDQTPEAQLNLHIDDLYTAADADSVGLAKEELATILLTIGDKYNHGLPPGAVATPPQIAAFWRSLQLRDLALAHACALGRERAWQLFMTGYRGTLIQAATAITSSAVRGRELADSLYAELFGLTERGQLRKVSPLAYYSGRGSLKGFLRAALAQRNVDHHRRTDREMPLPTVELEAESSSAGPTPELLSRLGDSLSVTLGSLAAEDRFLLSAWFLDRRTLLEISRVLGVHEATVSRRLQRLTARLHLALIANLHASGLSKAAAEEALATDPRDLDVNLRLLLQASQREAFPEQEPAAQPERT
jgi:RNA polymerase sigma-70 factor, ECF subfamily